MQKRVKSYENRIEREIEEKEGLLNDIEDVTELKLMPLPYYKERLIQAREFSLRYKDAKAPVFEPLTFEVKRGDRVFLRGENGCGKSSLIKAILNTRERAGEAPCFETVGELEVPQTLILSYINQDTSHLSGMLSDYSDRMKLDHTLLLSLLRQLDFERTQFQKPMEQYSEGQKKKVLIATSLLTPAHLYIWDEPLNYIDIFTRMQIEKLILKYQPTMIVVEHDVRFAETIATGVIDL